MVANSFKHGYSGTRLYRIYAEMVGRCSNPKIRNYPRYGGRGIKVCDEWLNNRVSFFKWAEDHGYDDSLSIDRIDNNGNYCPENCCWTTPKAQANNRRSNVWAECRGERHTLAEWSDISGVPKNRISWRLKNGWSVERAIFEKPMSPNEAGTIGTNNRWKKERGKNGRKKIGL